MEVANPIYDAVFKFLLDDERAARLLIGQIAGLDVQSLAVSPQEVVAPEHRGEAPPSLTLFRMDFAARVRTAEGEARQVLIEIQKAKAPTVVERFRRYLGQQYASRGNIVADGSGGSEAVPIVTIYLLGYDLGFSAEAVIDVCPRVTERLTGRVLDARHPFVEGIHHRSHIVQIPHLKRDGQDELSRFLTIFDQGRALAERDNHVLAFQEGEYPARWGFVLRQLQRAMAEEEVQRYMDGEDRLLKDSMLLAQRAEHERQRAERERQRADQERQRADQERQRADQEREEKEQERQRADQEREEKEQERQRADQEREEKEQERQRADQERQRANQEREEKEHERQRTERERHEKEELLARAIRRLHYLGRDTEEIARTLAVDPEHVRRVLSA